MATWTATTAPVDRGRAEGRFLTLLMADNVKIFKGDIVRIEANGYATNAAPAAGDMCAGIATETVDNTTTGHTAGGKSIIVDSEGVFQVFKASAGITDVGTLCYCSEAADAQTVVSGTGGLTHATLVGAAVGRVFDPVTKAADTTRLWIKLTTLQQIAS